MVVRRAGPAVATTTTAREDTASAGWRVNGIAPRVQLKAKYMLAVNTRDGTGEKLKSLSCSNRKSERL